MAEKNCTNKQTNRHCENNGHLAVNQFWSNFFVVDPTTHANLGVQSKEYLCSGLKCGRIPILVSASVVKYTPPVIFGRPFVKEFALLCS